MSSTIENRWIWPFELQEKIGEGGMGVVYRARYVKNDRMVAVKLLPGEVANNPTVFERFRRELQALKSLRHPNIVHCFGGVCEEGQQFYAMELVDGGTLDQVLRKRGRLPWEQVIEYGLQICAALGFAHERGIIHRDVKPGNFLLCRKTGELKLSDFGIALAMTAPKLTSDGMTVGSYHYMAPEQIRGKPPTSPQTDLYAVGCVLFELLTGHPPFEADNPAAIMHKHLREQAPRVGTYAMDCPAPLENLIAQLLEKLPENRPANAAMVARALKGVTQTVTIGARQLGGTMANTPPSLAETDDVALQTARPQRGAMGVAALMIVALCAVVVGQWASNRPDPHLIRSAELWVDAYDSDVPAVRVVAARALGEIGPIDHRIAAQLQNGLTDQDAEVRHTCIVALGNLGGAARPAIPALLRIQNNDLDALVRADAALAIRKIRQAQMEDSPLWTVTSTVFAVLLTGCGIVGWRLVRELKADIAGV